MNELSLEKLLNQLDGYEIKNNMLVLNSNNRIRTISDFLPFPVEEITCYDGCSKEKRFVICAYSFSEQEIQKLECVEINASALNSMNFVTEKWGLRATIFSPSTSHKDNLRCIISKLGKHADKRTVYKHTGWIMVQNKYCFLYNGGAIGCNDISVELGGKLSRYSLSENKITISKKRKAIKQLLSFAEREVIYPLIAITFLSPLSEFFRECGYEPAFILYLLGRTQTKKSTLAALFLSFFGSFTSSSLPCSFKDTLNALEKKCFYLKDVLTVIDDFHPTTHYRERQEMEQKAQYLSRGYGDRTAKDRMCSDTTLKNGYIPRGNAVITGEDFPDIGQSGSARNFIIEITPNSIYSLDTLSALQQAAEVGIMSSVMKDYILWLIPQTNNISSALKEKFLSFRKKAIEEKINVYGRTGDIVSWLKIGLDYFTDFCENTALLSADVLSEIRNNSWKILSDLSVIQFEKSEEEKPASMFISAIREMCLSREIVLKEKNQPHCDFGTKISGFYDNEFYYFIPDTIYNSVVKFYKEQNTQFPLTRQQIFNALANENLIITEETKNGKSNTRQVRIDGKKQRYLTFRKSEIENI